MATSRYVLSRRSYALEPTDARRLALERGFRAAHGRVSAALMRRFGVQHLALIETAVQDAGLKALTHWNPEAKNGDLEGWLLRVAHNGLVDVLRRERKSTS